ILFLFAGLCRRIGRTLAGRIGRPVWIIRRDRLPIGIRLRRLGPAPKDAGEDGARGGEEVVASMNLAVYRRRRTRHIKLFPGRWTACRCKLQGFLTEAPGWHSILHTK